jgi:sterol 3beta-glucosyltransferase
MTVPFLYNFSPSVVPPPLDWTEWIHVTGELTRTPCRRWQLIDNEGYWFLENADESAAKDKKQWSPPDGLLEFMEGAKSKGKKIVYM